MTMTKVLGLAAASAFLALGMPAQDARAASLINPGAAAAVQGDAQRARPMTTEVHWHYRHRWHRGHYGRWHGWHRHHHRW